MKESASERVSAYVGVGQRVCVTSHRAGCVSVLDGVWCLNDHEDECMMCACVVCECSVCGV